MPQPIVTYADSMGVVSPHKAHHDSLAEAIGDTPDGMRIHVHQGYDRSVDGPVRITSRRHLSADHGTKLPPITVETTTKRPPGAYLEGFEAPEVILKGAKFTTLHDVHTTRGGFKCVDTDANSCNSVTLVCCTADRTTDTGFYLDHQAHATRLRDCTALGCQGYGVFVDGPASVVLSGLQAEDCAEAGVKGRRADSLTVRDSYIEGNARNSEDDDADLTLSDCPGFDLSGTRFHGLAATKAIGLYGDCWGAIRTPTFAGYDADPVLDDATGQTTRT